MRVKIISKVGETLAETNLDEHASYGLRARDFVTFPGMKFPVEILSKEFFFTDDPNLPPDLTITVDKLDHYG